MEVVSLLYSLEDLLDHKQEVHMFGYKIWKKYWNCSNKK